MSGLGIFQYLKTPVSAGGSYSEASNHPVSTESRSILIDRPVFKDLDTSRFQELLSKSLKVISGGSEAIVSFSRHGHENMVLLEGGILLVSAHAERHPAVKDLIRQSEASNVQITEFYRCNMSQLSQLSQLVINDSFLENTNLQRREKEALSLFEEAANANATDIQIVLDKVTSRIRFCVNDQFRDIREMNHDDCRELISCIYNMTTSQDGNDKPDEHQMGLISREGAGLPGNIESLRIQLSPAMGGSRVMVLRLLFGRKGTSGMRSLDQLGYEPEQIATLRRIQDIPFGLILIAGPTGSGKSTTLAVIMENGYLEHEGRRNYVSIENPAEYALSRVIQYEVKGATTEAEKKLRFAETFAATLRSKPHVIMVGEIREDSAADLTIQATVSGHECLSTIHAKSGADIITRLRGMGTDHGYLRDETIMKGLMFQRLIRSLCSCCIAPNSENPIRISPSRRIFLDIVCDGDFSSLRFRRKEGCKSCKYLKDGRVRPVADWGYKGQTIVAEVIEPSETYLSYVVEGHRSLAIKHWLESRDAITIFEHGIRKMWRSELDPFDVYRGFYNPSDLERLKNDSERRKFVREGLSAREDAKERDFSYLGETEWLEVDNLSKIAAE